MMIQNKEEYDAALERFKELFHADSCSTNYEESQILFKALEEYDNKHLKQDSN